MLSFGDMAKKLIFWASPHEIWAIFGISAQEGRRDFSNTAKFSQWQHLYTSYEATHDIKCLLLEIWPNNCFLGIVVHIIKTPLGIDLVRNVVATCLVQ